jgi:phytoene synthase
MNEHEAVGIARRTLAEKSRSFALAALLLPRRTRDEMALLYAFCRHVDDAIDLAPSSQRVTALLELQQELACIYAGQPTGDALLDAFAWLVRARNIPREYPQALLAGMSMDVLGARYGSLSDLTLYCYRVAGVVGLMACHVLGVSDAKFMRNAAHLGMAMQLTNICRDVAEDLADGRQYLPSDLLGGSLSTTPDSGSPERTRVCNVVARLLDEADLYYRSGDLGLSGLGLRSALSVALARHVYAAIGTRLRARSCDPFLGRAFVPGLTKLRLAVRALVDTLASLPARLSSRPLVRLPARAMEFPHDVLPL